MTIVKIKGIEVEMGGTVRVVPPLNLNSLEQLQDRLAGFSGGMDKESISIIKDAALAALKRNYPDITMEIVAEELDVSNMNEIFLAIMDVSGLRRKAIEEAKNQMATATLPADQ